MKRNAIESLEPLILMSASAAEVDVDVDAAEDNSAPEFFRWQQHVLVDENETFIQDIDAIDDDGDEVTFSVIQPRPFSPTTERDIFRIDASTGVLEFINPQDHDEIGNRTQTVRVLISDGKETVERPVWVNLRDVDNQPFGLNTPQFVGLTDGQVMVLGDLSPTQFANAVELEAVDADGQPVTFSIVGGAHQSFFSLVPRRLDDGFFGDERDVLVLSNLVPPPVERPEDGRYEVTLRVSDGELFSDVTILLQLENDPVLRGRFPPELTELGRNEVIDIVEGERVVAKLDGLDLDGDRIRYSVPFLPGTDNGLFSIFRDTLSFSQAADFEQPEDANGDNIYEVVVRLFSDDSRTTEVPVFVRVVDVNEDGSNAPPTFATAFSGGDTVAVMERTRSAYRFFARDEDNDRSGLRYSIRNDVERLFTIDPRSGELDFIVPPEYRADEDNQYEVTVRVSDGQDFDEISLIVEVFDFNEQTNLPPEFFRLDEGQQFFVEDGERRIFRAFATDRDRQELTYTVTGIDSETVRIDPSTGDVVFRFVPSADAPIDADRDGRYEFTVNANDGLSFTSRNVVVQVGDGAVSNLPPLLTNIVEGQVLDVVQNTTEVIAASATDPEEDTLSYAISGGADGSQFGIDSVTGELSFVSPPLFDAATDSDGDGRYEVALSVSDGRGSDSVAFVVNVLEEPEPEPEPPVSIPMVPPDTRPVIGNLYDGVVIPVKERQNFVSFLTGESRSDSPVTYSMETTPDSWQFSLDPNTGELAFFDTPDFELPNDHDSDNDYELILRVSDDEGSQTYDVVIRVEDASESDVTREDLYPDKRPKLRTIGEGDIIEIKEPRKDIVNLLGFDYRGMIFPRVPITYSMETTVDSWQFSLDSTTGELAFFDEPDFESPRDHDRDNDYELKLTVSDGERSRTYNVVIRVEDGVTGLSDPENGAPVFTNVYDGQRFLIPENERISLRIEAEDPEGDESRIFETQTDFFGVIVSGGEPFRVISTTGPAPTYEINQRPPLDFETPVDDDKDNVYELNLIAADEFQNFEEITLFFEITDVDEGENGNFNRTPEFVNVTSGQVIDVSEGILQAYNVDAVDLDDEPIVHSIVGGDDYWLFDIDPALGDIRFKERPIFAHAADAGGDNVYDLVVRIDDGDAFRDVDFQIRVNESV